jgi:hypothetical protein
LLALRRRTVGTQQRVDVSVHRTGRLRGIGRGLRRL